MKESQTQEALVHVGIWCLGEFGDLLVSGRAVGPDNQPIHIAPNEVMDLLIDISKKPPLQEKAHLTNALIAAACIKLVTRCPSEVDRIKKQLQKFETHISVDLQQRSCEFLEVLDHSWDATRAGILDRMPVSEKEPDYRPSGDTSIDEVPTPASSGPIGGGGGGGGGDLLDLGDLLGDGPAKPAAAQPPPPAGGGMDLLDMLGDSSPAPAPMNVMPAAPAPADDGLLGLFGDAPAPAAPSGDIPPFLGYEKGGLRIMFNIKKDVDATTHFVAVFHNLTDAPMTSFVFEAAVPKYLKLNLQQATSALLEPHSSNVTQALSIQNMSNGERPVLMKLRIGYLQNGNQVQDLAQVSNFPPGV